MGAAARRRRSSFWRRACRPDSPSLVARMKRSEIRVPAFRFAPCGLRSFPILRAPRGALFERACYSSPHGRIDDVIEMPEALALEGAGDCLWDARRGLFWMGCGFRSDVAAAQVVEQTFGVPCVALELANPSYYHLDTAMCALPCGAVVYY